jgi:hypothetical protein
MAEEDKDVDMAGSGDDDDSSGDSDDSSSSSGSDVPDVAQEDMERIMRLEAALEANPNQYDAHVEVC